MFFEDEKDILDNGADIQISEDGTVTWEDVLSDADEDLVSVKKSPAQKQKPKDIDLGDELELVEEDDDVDDAELAKILNETEASTTSTASYEESDEEFDIDSQLANAALEQNEAQAQGEVEIKPRKVEKKQSSSAMPFLLAILVALGVVGGLYYYFTMFAEDGGELSLNKDVPALATVQEQLNNTTQEEIANRTKEPEAEAQTQEAEKENIPVVNEENADEIKPEEKQPEEKKQVINVVPTGRPNPFMPIQKYVAVKIDDTVVDFDKVGIPKPPEEYGEPSGPVTKLMTIVVSGIMYDEQKPSAIITLDNNDYFVQEGDKLDDYKVLDIGKNFVVIALGKNTYKANIGEEFKVSSDFYGSAQYMPSNQGGGRQYQLIKETKATPLNQKTGRYVSESEVEINAR